MQAMTDCRGWAESGRAAVLAGALGADGPLAGLAFAAKDSFDVRCWVLAGGS